MPRAAIVARGKRISTEGYRKQTTERTNMKTTPAIMGTAVRRTISIGLFSTEPETIITTAETGETARKRLPARPMGTEMAMGEMPAAAASAGMSGTMAKNSAVPEPVRVGLNVSEQLSTLVRAQRISVREQNVGVSRDCREWSAQVVRDRAEEVGAKLLVLG